MSLRIVPVTGTDEAEHAAAHAVKEAAWLHERPYGDVLGGAAERVALLRPSTILEVQAWAAVLDGQAVGWADAGWPLLDNTHVGDISVAVLPAHRRHGVGTALLDAVLAAADVRGRTTLFAETERPLDVAPAQHGGTTFLRARGFEVGLQQTHYVLRLPVPESALGELADEVAGPASAFSLVSWVDHCPERWAGSLCRLLTAFLDEAPTGELAIGTEEWTVERLRESEARRVAQGRTSHTTAAVAPDGTLAGHTELVVSDAAVRGGVDQSGTLVLPSHRGHRLGLAMKVENLRRLQTADPRERLLHTWNAKENQAMIDVNTRLGFEAVETSDLWQRRGGADR